MFVVIIRLESEIFKVIAKVKRAVKNGNSSEGMGVQLLSPSIDYLDYLNTLKEQYQ